MLWLAPIVRGLVVNDIGRLGVLAVVAGVTMVAAVRREKTAPFWVAVTMLALITTALLVWPSALGVVVECGARLRTVVTSLLMAASVIAAANLAAWEMKPLPWAAPIKLAGTTMVAFVSAAPAVCIGVMAHIAMGGEWL